MQASDPLFMIGVRSALVFRRLLQVVGSPTIAVYNKEVLKAIGTVIAAERTRQGLRTSDLGIEPHILEDIEAGRSGITTTQLETVATALQLDPRVNR